MAYPWPFTDERHADLPLERWDQLHPSWKALEVARSAQSDEEARTRLLPRFDIPADVLEQWLCAHYFNVETALNYGWIDYDRAQFVLERWTTPEIIALRVTDAYQRFVDERSAANWTLDETPFARGSGDEDAWRTKGTWRLPPVAIVPDGFGDPPADADLTAAPQLVEGHTRFSNLRRFLNLGAGSGVVVADDHLLYVLRPS